MFGPVGLQKIALISYVAADWGDSGVTLPSRRIGADGVLTNNISHWLVFAALHDLFRKMSKLSVIRSNGVQIDGWASWQGLSGLRKQQHTETRRPSTKVDHL